MVSSKRFRNTNLSLRYKIREPQLKCDIKENHSGTTHTHLIKSKWFQTYKINNQINQIELFTLQLEPKLNSCQ